MRSTERRGTRLYLVRHAAATIRSDRPTADWHLSPEGRAAVGVLATEPHWSGLCCLHTSPEAKAACTAQRIAACHGLPMYVVQDLREVENRTWVDQCRYRSQVQSYLEGDAVDAWEPKEAALGRMRGCIGAITTRHKGEEVAVVSHGLALTLYLAGLLGLDRKSVV